MGSQELSGLIVIENISEAKLLSCPWTDDIWAQLGPSALKLSLHKLEDAFAKPDSKG